MRRNKIKLYPDNTWLWLAGANLLLSFILVTWLSIGTAQAWEFQSPSSFEDDEPIIKKPTPAAPPEIHSASIPSAKQRRRHPKSNPTRYPL